MTSYATTADGKPIYWAASNDMEEVVGVLEDRVNDYYDMLVRRRVWEVMRRSYRVYYGMDDYGSEHESSLITFQGEQGELSSIKINHYRNLIRHQINLAVQSRPEFSPRALNQDVRSLSDAKVARGMLEYVLRERGLQTALVQSLETERVLSRAYTWLYWDPEMLGPDGGEKQGDIRCVSLTPLDVVVDTLGDPRDPDWVLVRQPVNKWDLVARYPEFEDELVSSAIATDAFRYTIGEGPSGDLRRSSEDQIFVYHWYHRRTDAMPGGGYMQFVSSEAILVPRMDLPYQEIPVYRIAASDVIGSSISYADNWDNLGLQQAYNAAMSVILTNLDSFGLPNVAINEGTDISPANVAGALNVWKIPPGGVPPQVVQMLSLPPQAFEIPKIFKGDMQELQGINATMRGAPEANVKSGAMAALFRGLAEEFNTPIRRAWSEHLTAVATGVMQIYKSHAEGDRIAIIIGKDGEQEVETFTREKLEGFDRFTVELQSPIESNAAGRMEFARMFYEKGDMSPEEVVNAARTGEFGEKWKAQRSQRRLILEENEALQGGEQVIASLTDHHPRHMQEHASLLATRRAREDEALASAVEAHLAEHMSIWRQMEVQAPGMAAVLGIPPAPPPGPPAGMPGQPPGPPGGPPPGPSGPPPEPPPGAEGSAPNRAGLPVDPSTGEPSPVPPPPGAGAPPGA